MQDPEIHFIEAFNDLEALATELSEIRNKLYQEALDKAKSLCTKSDIHATIRVRTRRKIFEV